MATNIPPSNPNLQQAPPTKPQKDRARTLRGDYEEVGVESGSGLDGGAEGDEAPADE